jgi:hypothetical protein
MKRLRFLALAIIPVLVITITAILPGNAVADTWGDTWPGAPSSEVNALAWAGSCLYAGSANGHIYRYDGGTTWTDVGNPTFSVNALIWTGSGLYAGCGNGHVYRYDGGNIWTDMGIVGGGASLSLAWAGYRLYSGNADDHVYRYDGGTTWTDAGNPGSGFVNGLVWTGSHLYAACTGSHIYQYDELTTWVDMGDLGSNVLSIAWSRVRSVQTNIYAGCTNKKVYRSSGGTTWTDIGTLTAAAHTLCFGGMKLYAGCSGGHVYRYEGGTYWTDIGTVDTQVNSLSHDGTYLYAGCFNGHIYKDQLVETVAAAVSGGHGILSPGTQAVNTGANATITIAADPGYHIASIIDNGVSKSPTSSYIIESVATDHSVVVKLEKDSSVFYFAEGTCRAGFEPYICIQNPGASDAIVTITYMLGDGNTKPQKLVVGPHSRSTVTVKSILGEGDDAAHDFSAKVECTNGQQIIAERPMYFNYKGVWTGGHDVVGFTPQ